MCSFYHLPSTVIGHAKHRTLNAAYSFYNVATTVRRGTTRGTAGEGKSYAAGLIACLCGSHASWFDRVASISGRSFICFILFYFLNRLLHDSEKLKRAFPRLARVPFARVKCIADASCEASPPGRTF